MTWARQGRVECVGRQRAGEKVLVRAQVVSLARGGAGQAEVLVVGAHASTGNPGAGGRLLSSQLPDLNTEKRVSL